MIPWLLPIAQRLILPFSHHLQGLHGLRIHHQIVVWKDLSEVDKEPLCWSWKIENSNYTPIMADAEAVPPELLRIVRCGCKGPCGSKCSCRKVGLKCSSTCKECHGLTCSKAPVIESESDERDYQWSFLDAFEWQFLIWQSYLYIGKAIA